MGYVFQVEESVEAGVRRIATELIDDSISRIEDPGQDRHTTVHEVRKNCKKMRGLLRLARPALGDEIYAEENARFRDAARSLSALRDAEAMIETYDELMGIFGELVDLRRFNTIRDELERRKARIAEDTGDLERRLEAFLLEMRDALERVQSWEFHAEGFDALAGGFRRVYGRGRREMARAYKDPTTEHVHEWRKRAKYHWYHARLLQYVWRPVVSPLADELDVLSDLLGDEHNLAVLEAMLLAQPAAFGDERVIQATLGLIGRRRAELREMAWPLGQRIYAEKPRAITSRFRSYWEAWHAGHDRSPLFSGGAVGPVNGSTPGGKTGARLSRVVSQNGAPVVANVDHDPVKEAKTAGTHHQAVSIWASGLPVRLVLAFERLTIRQLSIPTTGRGRIRELRWPAGPRVRRAISSVETALADVRSVLRYR